MFQRVTSTLPIFFLAMVPAKALPESPTRDGVASHASNHNVIATYLTPRTTQRFQVRLETEYVPRTVTRYRTVVRERLVAKTVPVPATILQTRYREERYTINRPALAIDGNTKLQTNSTTQGSTSGGVTWTRLGQVRKPPIQVNQIQYQTEKRFIRIKQHELEAYQEVIYEPVTKVIHTRDTHTVYTARRVQSRLSPQYVDPFSPAIIAGYSSFNQPIRQPTH